MAISKHRFENSPKESFQNDTAKYGVLKKAKTLWWYQTDIDNECSFSRMFVKSIALTV